MTDSKFRNINRLFVPSFKNGDNDPARNFFDAYYMSLVQMKDFNALIDNKPFLINRKKANVKKQPNQDDKANDIKLNDITYQKVLLRIT